MKQSRQMEERYMLLELEIKRERREAKAEGIAQGIAQGKAEDVLELLEDLGSVPEELREIIMQERSLDILKKWHKLAARAESMEEFMKGMKQSK